MLVFQASNPALWLGLEGSLESNDAVAGLTTTVSSMDEGQQQMNESIAQLNDPSGNLLSHSEEVETMSIEAMEVDVHVRSVLSVSDSSDFLIGPFFSTDFNRRQPDWRNQQFADWQFHGTGLDRSGN